MYYNLTASNVCDILTINDAAYDVRKEITMKGMSFAFLLAAVVLMCIGLPAQMSFAAEGNRQLKAAKTSKESAMPASENKKILIAYFSHSGNTREIANQIRQITGGDIFEIQSVKPYPTEYNAVVAQARTELSSGFRPELKTKIKDIKPYDVVLIGYPNWWGTVPAPVRVFLTDNDLAGKAIAPFCTHEGSGLGVSVADIEKFCPRSTLLEGLAIRGSTVKTAQNKVAEWLRKNKIKN